MNEIKSRMQSISGILERLSKLPDAEQNDLEHSIVSGSGYHSDCDADTLRSLDLNSGRCIGDT